VCFLTSHSISFLKWKFERSAIHMYYLSSSGNVRNAIDDLTFSSQFIAPFLKISEVLLIKKAKRERVRLRGLRRWTKREKDKKKEKKTRKKRKDKD